MYQSEIRDSKINTLLEKVSKENYNKYLYKVTLSRIRRFNNQSVTFDFPVTALIGPNGGGKTTILGAAACAYKEIRPREFFVRSGELDDSMQQWKIIYELIDRTIKRDRIVRTASYRSSKWNRNALSRDVSVFGVSRTVPATERAELKRCISNRFSVNPEQITEIESSVSSAIQKILGKDVSKYTHIQIDNRGRISLLAAKTETDIKYSEFHFGAGESSVIRMVMGIEYLPDNSLILIEEIENGLHPVAAMRMVEHLIDVAERKKIQVIFTTHSDDALKPLPSKAIWAAINGEVIQGKLDIHSLRAIRGEIDAKLVIFTEDAFAKMWIEAILRSLDGIAVDLIEVHSMEGDGTAVKVNEYHNLDPSKRFPSVCFIDGDSRQEESNEKLVFRLPGGVPESFIYNQVEEALDNCAGVLAVALHRKYEDHERISRVVREIKLTNRDPHLLYSQVGKKLGLIPEAVICGGFLSVWTQAYSEAVDDIISQIKDFLPTESNSIDN